MKSKNTKLKQHKAIVSVVALVIIIFTQGYSQTNDSYLLLQQTPLDGGNVNLGTGIHSFELNSEVGLTAVPKPGYQFVYWLGDVSDPTSSSTEVYLDAPKIVIAVFERTRYEFFMGLERLEWSPGSQLRASAVNFYEGTGDGEGAKRPSKTGGEPVPEPDDFPVPLPEPATILLIGLAIPFLLKQSAKNKV